MLSTESMLETGQHSDTSAELTPSKIIKNHVYDMVDRLLKRGNGVALVHVGRIGKAIRRLFEDDRHCKEFIGKTPKMLNAQVNKILRDYPGSQFWMTHSKKNKVARTVYKIHSSNTLEESPKKYLSKKDRILEYIKELESPIFTLSEISKHLEILKGTVSNSLCTLYSEGVISRLEPGVYCLPGRERVALDHLNSIHNPVTFECLERILLNEYPLTAGRAAKVLKTNYSHVFNALQKFVNNGLIINIGQNRFCLPGQVAEVQKRSVRDRIIQVLSEVYPMTPLQVAKRLGIEKGRVARQLCQMLKKREVSKVGYGLYCLPGQVVDIKQTNDHKALREYQHVSIADAIILVIRYMSASTKITVSELASITDLSASILSKAVERLIDARILLQNDGHNLIFAPQETHQRLRLIQLISESTCWRDIIKVLIIEYMRDHQRSSGRNFQRLFRIRRSIRNQLDFLYSTEDQHAFNEAIDILCIEGILEQLEGNMYRFNQFSEVIT